MRVHASLLRRHTRSSEAARAGCPRAGTGAAREASARLVRGRERVKTRLRLPLDHRMVRSGPVSSECSWSAMAVVAKHEVGARSRGAKRVRRAGVSRRKEAGAARAAQSGREGEESGGAIGKLKSLLEWVDGAVSKDLTGYLGYEPSVMTYFYGANNVVRSEPTATRREQAKHHLSQSLSILYVLAA